MTAELKCRCGGWGPACPIHWPPPPSTAPRPIPEPHLGPYKPLYPNRERATLLAFAAIILTAVFYLGRRRAR